MIKHDLKSRVIFSEESKEVENFLDISSIIQKVNQPATQNKNRKDETNGGTHHITYNISGKLNIKVCEGSKSDSDTVFVGFMSYDGQENFKEKKIWIN